MDDPRSWLYLALSILGIILSGFFSLSETAFTCFNKYRFEVEAENGNKNSKLVLWLNKHFDRTLIGVLIGNNICNVLLSVVFTFLFLDWMGFLNNEAVTSLIATIVLTLIVYFFSETLPKQLARKIPNACVRFAALPLTIIIFLFYPLVLLFQGLTWLINKIFPNKKNPTLTEDDFNEVLEKNERGGLLEENETDLIQASFDFADTSVKEVLTPKRRVFMVNIKGMSPKTLAETLCLTKYSRIPVYVENKNKVIGIIIVAKYLDAYRKDPNLKISSFIEKPYIVTPRVHMDDLLDGFREKRVQMAIVKNKEEVVGIITMEDVLEELVGPISESNAKTQEGVSQ